MKSKNPIRNRCCPNISCTHYEMFNKGNIIRHSFYKMLIADDHLSTRCTVGVSHEDVISRCGERRYGFLRSGPRPTYVRRVSSLHKGHTVKTWQSMASVVLFLALGAVPRSASSASGDAEARVELAVFTSVYAVALGVYTALELDLNPRPAAWLSAGLGGAAVYGALNLGPKLEMRDTRLLESATTWVMMDTLLVQAELGQKSDLMLPWIFGTGALAFAGAAAAMPYYEGTVGEISLINSGGIWVPLGGLLLGATLHLGSGRHLPRDVVVLNILGLGAATYLTRAYSPTREQVLYMDGGMLLGVLSGALMGVGLFDLHERYEVITGLALAGMVLGAALAVDKYGFDAKGSKTTGEMGAESAAESAAIIPLRWGTW